MLKWEGRDKFQLHMTIWITIIIIIIIITSHDYVEYSEWLSLKSQYWEEEDAVRIPMFEWQILLFVESRVILTPSIFLCNCTETNVTN